MLSENKSFVLKFGWRNYVLNMDSTTLQQCVYAIIDICLQTYVKVIKTIFTGGQRIFRIEGNIFK
jgi:hypothetical protein